MARSRYTKLFVVAPFMVRPTVRRRALQGTTGAQAPYYKLFA
jgi:hypothetical protein